MPQLPEDQMLQASIQDVIFRGFRLMVCKRWFRNSYLDDRQMRNAVHSILCAGSGPSERG